MRTNKYLLSAASSTGLVVLKCQFRIHGKPPQALFSALQVPANLPAAWSYLTRILLPCTPDRVAGWYQSVLDITPFGKTYRMLRLSPVHIFLKEGASLFLPWPLTSTETHLRALLSTSPAFHYSCIRNSASPAQIVPAAVAKHTSAKGAF